MSVGQQDPLVEYRRRGQHLFDDMQNTLRHDVLMHIFHAEPISQEDLDKAIETELTRAARGSVDNASQIETSETEFQAEDFERKNDPQVSRKKAVSSVKKARKNERKRKTAAKRRKK
jgi:preprotein translocase subunit SecA